MRHIVFQGRKYKRVIMNIRGDALFHDILKQVNGLTIPDTVCDDEHTRYALLELINNSLRAHRKNKVLDPVRTELSIVDGRLNISITDKGGGFDLSTLPYDMDDPVDEIDTNSRRFQEYREQNHYMHFGMGLLVARRLFPVFSIRFFNRNGDFSAFVPEDVKGTRIDMEMELNDG